MHSHVCELRHAISRAAVWESIVFDSWQALYGVLLICRDINVRSSSPRLSCRISCEMFDQDCVIANCAMVAQSLT